MNKCPNCSAEITMPWTAFLYKFVYVYIMMFCIYSFDLEFMEFIVIFVSTMGLDSYTRYKFVPLIIKS